MTPFPLEKQFELVHTWHDILNNFLQLERYRKSKNQNKSDYYVGLIKRGTCFVVTGIEDNIVFAPSRFLGYLNNNMDKHISNPSKDGRITNPAIESITSKKFTVNEPLNRAYQKFCLSMGITPRNKGSFGVSRKYISFGISDISDETFLVDDIKDIENQKDISKTEKEQLIKARQGQGKFRDALIKYWGECACTGCKELKVLRASHIKPWSLCDNKERLDRYNGLLCHHR